jgi:hypothetical protein
MCGVGTCHLVRPRLGDAALGERRHDRRVGPLWPRLGVCLPWFQVRNVAHGMFVGGGAVDGASEQFATEVRRPTGQGVPPEIPVLADDPSRWPDLGELLTTRSLLALSLSL